MNGPPPRSTLSPYTTLSQSPAAPEKEDHTPATLGHMPGYRSGRYWPALTLRRGFQQLALDRARLLIELRKRAIGVRLHRQDRKSTRLNSSHANISYAVFCLK